jgi:4-hydroxy-3-methylbut-2-en-1-yl diphosphate reductase
VNMAIESLELAIQAFGTPLYVFHEIVHNRWVVEHFRGEGVVFVNNLAEAPEGSHLLYSAHGIPPEIRHQASRRGLKTIDATCPLVTKVHSEAIRFAREGYSIILIGHPGHDEVVGTMGEVPESMILVKDILDVDRLTLEKDRKVAYLTQTTLSAEDAGIIIARLRERFPQIVGPARADICYATQNRQEAVTVLADEADLLLVVGSQNSSNSQRLAELARSHGVTAHLIDGPADINLGWLRDEMTVVITAGASAPELIVQKCIKFICDNFSATVETRCICEEQVRFTLPEPLRRASEGECNK